MMEDDRDPILNSVNGSPSYGTRNLRNAANFGSLEAVAESPEGDTTMPINVEILDPNGATSLPPGFVPGEHSIESLSRTTARSLSHAGEEERPGELQASGRRIQRTLGTFGGVFCPVALSMFSTLLYLRGGFVVGQAGLIQAIAMLVIAYIILMLTVLSICAISTNGAIEGGGAYYMISRALGPEFGGSIGFLFFMGNILSGALYISGFTEGVLQNFGVGGSAVSGDSGLPTEGQWWKYLYSTVVLVFCCIICLIGSAMFARTSAIILLIVTICTGSVIVSIFAKNEVIQVDIPPDNHLVYPNDNITTFNISGNYTGLSSATFRENLMGEYGIDYSTMSMMNFATVFAILFSSVTGILNGANMSGELKDPARSIPRGTVSAIIFTFITYIILTVLIAGSCTRYLLKNDYVFLQQINLWNWFVVIGIFAATLSAALGNLIGASRILEALGNDQLFWSFLKPATVTTKGGNPFVSVIISWVLMQLVLLVGSLNAIAPITTVFYLLSYAAVNLACLALDLASAPNFRPTFKLFHWSTCVLGLVGCLVMCFLISSIYSSIALLIMLILVIVLHLRSLPSSWGSISQALIFHQVRKYLLMLDPRKAHVKYWRPQILLMVAHPRQSCALMDFINDIKKSGLYVIGHVKLGKLDEYKTDPVLEEQPRWMSLINHLKIKAFVEVTLAGSVSEGLCHLMRLSGLGGMKPNTICLGFFDSAEPVDQLSRTRMRRRRFFGSVEAGSYMEVEGQFDPVRPGSDAKSMNGEEYVKMIRNCLKMQKNVCLCRHFHLLDKNELLDNRGDSSGVYVDVWPVNLFRPETAAFFDNTCLFMLQLACILDMVPRWRRHTTLRVFLCVNAQVDNTIEKEHKLNKFLLQLRILARVQIVSWDHLQHYMQGPGPGQQVDVNAMDEFQDVPDDFMKAINEMIAANSSRTAVSFLYLPRPPADPGLNKRYLELLDALSANLKPTVLVHGLHPVTSTTL